jgi:ADP-ribosyl-[dinitrogen reductase] hydrolase
LGDLCCPEAKEQPSDFSTMKLIADGPFKQKQPMAIVGSGFVVRSLEAALWAFYLSDSFRDGALRAVNLGNDADTTGAIYGQLAGIFYGVNAIPKDWIERVTMREFIRERADALFDFSTVVTGRNGAEIKFRRVCAPKGL